MKKQKENPKMDEKIITEISGSVQALINEFIKSGYAVKTLSGRERMRLFGTGTKNFGFIEKAFDIARDNPQYMPPFLRGEEMERGMRVFEELRQLGIVLREFSDIVNTCVLVNGDKRFREALRLYESLKEQSRFKVPGASVFFNALSPFFRRRRKSDEEPTEKKLKRDFKKLLSGKADGKIEIVNETPKTSSGKRKVSAVIRKKTAGHS